MSKYREMQCALIDATNLLRDLLETGILKEVESRIRRIRKHIDDSLGSPTIADVYKIRKAAGRNIYTGEKNQ